MSISAREERQRKTTADGALVPKTIHLHMTSVPAWYHMISHLLTEGGIKLSLCFQRINTHPNRKTQREHSLLRGIKRHGAAAQRSHGLRHKPAAPT